MSKNGDTPKSNDSRRIPDGASLRSLERQDPTTLARWRPREPLGAILVSVGALTDTQLNRALVRQRKAKIRTPIGQILVSMGIVGEDTLEHALTIQRSLEERRIPTA